MTGLCNYLQNRKCITYRNAVRGSHGHSEHVQKFGEFWPCDFWDRSMRACRQTDRQTSHMARCVTFAVARIPTVDVLEIGEILHIFPSGTKRMGDRGSKKGLHHHHHHHIYFPKITKQNHYYQISTFGRLPEKHMTHWLAGSEDR